MVNHFCTADEVKSAINFPSTGAPVTDADITTFIGYAEEEIEEIYHTNFGNIDTTGTATAGDTTTITVAATPYTADEYIGYVVWVHTGTNSGEYREITTNTDNDLTVSPAFTAAIDNTSEFRITKLGYKDQTVDGSGTKTQITNFFPLINLISLTIDSTSVTPSKVYKYENSGKMTLKDTAEVTYFSDTHLQLIDMQYVYGVYPFPQIIKRLCIVLAGIRTLTAQIAGTYNDFTSVSLPGGFTGSLGEPYINIQSSLNFLQGEARGIIYGTQSTGQVSADLRTQSSYSPFTLFG